MRSPENLPTQQSLRKAHTVRKFRRGNQGHTAYLGRKNKPWTTHNPTRSAAQ